MSTARPAMRIDGLTIFGLLIVVWLGVTAYFLMPSGSNGGGGYSVAAIEPPEDSAGPSEPTKKGGEESAKVSDAEQEAIDASMKEFPKLPLARIETTEGPIVVRLFSDKVPNTAENFVDLIKKKFYDGIIFHRVIEDFMLQTGDPKGTGTGGREDKGMKPKVLQDEFHPELKHDRPGILSMANAGPNTGDTQFFITTVPTPWLDNRHAVFGEVIYGMDVVEKIEKTPKRGERPVNPPKMITVRMIEGEPAK